MKRRIWLFDLDNTLHDASHAAFASISEAMTGYIVQHIGLEENDATPLRQRYWKRYGATLLGLVRHHGVGAAHFLEQTHRLPGLEERVRSSAHDRAALRRLSGHKYVLTNAPRAYARRVLGALGLGRSFDAVIGIEDMAMFGQLRPKPDARMLRRVAARLKVPTSRCVLVEDTLEHQKAARGIGMQTVWMQRYLGGRFRGHPAGRRLPGQPLGAEASAANAVARLPEVGVHPCPDPRYVCAKIKSLQALARLR
ncbi:MAG: pyrimidine 5'-nucleotidase [Pseudomonadota bacterium]|nr:pyrimidine 5'-nucleotidase [Pseudomonadota bacterium]